MHRYFFHVAYNGTHYRGWQRQPNVRSVQEVLEDTLAKTLSLPSVTIIGCGRTDAGVHASQFFFHTDLRYPIADELKFMLNKTLPDDIAVFDILLVQRKVHARFNATQRAYDYFIHTYKNPFLANRSFLYIDKPLDLDKMQQAVQMLPQYDDYRAFCKKPDSYNTTICKVTRAQLAVANNQQEIRFSIEANRFLRGQIRIIVQKLIDIGIGKFPLEAFELALKEQKRPALIKPAPPQGLFLSKVFYPFLETTTPSNFFNEQEWQDFDSKSQ